MNRDEGPERDRLRDELQVLACRAGSAEGFRALVARWQEPLWRHAHRITGREDAAWDVLQEAWLAIADGIASLSEPRRFRGWAYTIVTRRAADWLERARRDEGRRAPEADTEPAMPEEDEAAASAVDLLRRALRRLDEERRLLLSMHYVDELDLKEIAAILRVPEGTVKSRLHHARRELRDVIERIDR